MLYHPLNIISLLYKTIQPVIYKCSTKLTRRNTCITCLGNQIILEIGALYIYIYKYRHTYSRTPVSTDSVTAVYRGPKKNENKKIYGSWVSKRAPSENVPWNGEIQQPKGAQYLTYLPLSPFPLFPAELASVPLLTFSLFALVAALSQCLCSESTYLSIQRYRIYVCYTNITLYTAFGIIRSFT
jgi:hypothetical protein